VPHLVILTGPNAAGENTVADQSPASWPCQRGAEYREAATGVDDCVPAVDGPESDDKTANHGGELPVSRIEPARRARPAKQRR
jgi:hypothetical protein